MDLDQNADVSIRRLGVLDRGESAVRGCAPWEG